MAESTHSIVFNEELGPGKLTKESRNMLVLKKKKKGRLPHRTYKFQ